MAFFGSKILGLNVPIYWPEVDLTTWPRYCDLNVLRNISEDHFKSQLQKNFSHHLKKNLKPIAFAFTIYSNIEHSIFEFEIVSNLSIEIIFAHSDWLEPTKTLARNARSCSARLKIRFSHLVIIGATWSDFSQTSSYIHRSSGHLHLTWSYLVDTYIQAGRI